MSGRIPLAPVAIDEVLDDPSEVVELVRRAGPYWSVQRYLKDLTEMSALSDAGKDPEGRVRSGPMFVAPWFRGDWAYDRPKVEGASLFLDNPRFEAAARSMIPDAAEIRPQIVYANLHCPMPQVDPGHVDVPAFRGFDRREQPVWLLVLMHKSGLFERYHLQQITAVAWYYDGEGGGFRYWPEGPDSPPVDRPCRSNTAVVGDNDTMFHCVLQVGPEGERIRMPRGLTLGAQLRFDGEAWLIEDGGEIRARHRPDEVRLSVSWKAQVFRSEEELRLHDQGRDLLTLEEVKRTFLADLAARGVPHHVPEDLLGDDRFKKILSETYHYAPTCFEPRAAPA